MLLISSINESPFRPPPVEIAPAKFENASLIYDPAFLPSNALALTQVVNVSEVRPIELTPLVVHELQPAKVVNASLIAALSIARIIPTSYANPGGTGNRTAIITVTTTGTLAVGTTSNFVDGAFGNTSADSAWWGGGGAGLSITFDFGVGKAAVIQEVKHFASTTAAQGTWKWRGSQDGIAWTDLSAGFTFAGSTTGTVLGDLSANLMSYRFYQQLQISGITASAPWMQEWQFKIGGL